jgi:signal transduction histidine kinase
MKIAPYEVEVLTSSGNKIMVEVNGAKIEYDGKPASLVVLRDISERKKMEDKLRVVGKMTRHDVRNKLSAARANIFLAEKKLGGNIDASKHLREIDNSIEMVERIFDFARIYENIGMQELVYVEVEKSIKEAVALFSDLRNIEVMDDCSGLNVLADSLLRQIFYNLIHNSLTHGEKTNKIRVYLEEGKDELKLVYEDDGIGIPKSEKEKIFQEGYGRGTGYGLYLIKKICEVYGWTIKETGKQGKGAQFTITIQKLRKQGKFHYKLN